MYLVKIAVLFFLRDEKGKMGARSSGDDEEREKETSIQYSTINLLAQKERERHHGDDKSSI